MRILGVIVAAGRGRRLGMGPKAFVELDGESLVDRSIRLLRDAGVDEVVAVLPPDDPRLPSRSAIVARNPDPASGPLGSICSALSAVEPELPGAIVVHHVDHPFVALHTVRTLIMAAQEAGPDVARVVPRSGERRGHPIVVMGNGVVAIANADPANEMLRDVLTGAGNVLDVLVDDPGIFRNLNTRADLESKCI